jgi:hypothetical protein
MARLESPHEECSYIGKYYSLIDCQRSYRACLYVTPHSLSKSAIENLPSLFSVDKYTLSGMFDACLGSQWGVVYTADESNCPAIMWLRLRKSPHCLPAFFCSHEMQFLVWATSLNRHDSVDAASYSSHRVLSLKI